MRFSILQLLILVSLAGLACVSLKFANEVWWTVLSSVGLLLFMGMLVVAFVSRGERCVFAIGFVACVLTYGACLFLMGNSELSESRGWMPTTKLLQPAYRSVATTNPLPASGVELDTNAATQFGMMGMTVTATVSPNRTHFMWIGHLLWAILLGWIGGLFARWVHRGEQDADVQGQA